jgi:hypothetical protein
MFIMYGNLLNSLQVNVLLGFLCTYKEDILNFMFFVMQITQQIFFHIPYVIIMYNFKYICKFRIFCSTELCTLRKGSKIIKMVLFSSKYM